MELYPYQQVAIDKFRNQQHVLLGDDMGLGKTVVAIALDRVRRTQQLTEARIDWLNDSRKMTLVVTLKSLLGMWEEHFNEWAPELKVMIIDPKDRGTFVKAVLNQEADVFVCHWEVVRMEADLRSMRWLHVISDEVQKIKNRKAQLTVAFKRIRGLFKTAMSGTWADNRPDDGWSILNYLYDRQWTSYWGFFNYHIIQKAHNVGTCLVDDCLKYHRNAFKETVGVHDAEAIQRKIGPYYLRRRKSEVLADLPDKYYTRIGVDLHPQQRRAYDSMRRTMLAWVGEHEGQPLAAPVVISQLVRLQQFAVAFGELVPVRRKKKDPDPGEDPYEIVQALKLTEPSSKIDACLDIVDNNPTESIVFFSKSKQAIKLLTARLQKAGHDVVELTGDTPAGERTQIVKDFQAGKVKVFAGTIAAGGVGITLTKSSTVVFLDRDWSPSVNRQAEDRLHRIGQKNAVQVIDLVAKDSVDMGRLQKLELKWEWIKKILGDK